MARLRLRSWSVLVLTCSAACSLLGGPTSEELGKAEDHLWRAQRFYIHQRYAQALQQTELGLQLAPYHYGLNQLKGNILLRSAEKDDLKALEASLAQFETVRDLRANSDIEYITYVGLGEVHMALYKLHKRLADENTTEAGRKDTKPEDRERLTKEAAAHMAQYHTHLTKAEASFQELLDMGDGLLPANRFLFYLETDKLADLEGAEKAKQFEAAITRGLAYLKIVEERRDYYKARHKQEFRIAREADYERRIAEYRKREIECRSLLHQLYFHTDHLNLAIAQLDRVLELDPTNSAEYFNRARCYESLGKKQQARRDYEDFLRTTKLSFDSDRVRQARKSLAALGG